jgi:lipopolysaccharide transport system permease protein
LYHFNPFTYLIAIVREPIVSGSVPLSMMGWCAGGGIAIWALALVLIGRNKRRLALMIP